MIPEVNAESPLVSVLILNYCSADATIACTQSFLAQSIGRENLEVIVIDNGSPDGSEQQLREALSDLPMVHIVQTGGNRGFGAGYNTGVEHARGQYILLNNPVKMHASDSLEKFIAKLESSEGVGIIGPKLVHEDGSVRHSPRDFPSPFDVVIKRTFLQNVFKKRLAKYLQLSQGTETERVVDWVAGGCLFMRRELFTELGGFDDRFFLFFEDIDLCRRCAKLGQSVLYYPDIVANDRKSRLSEGGVRTLLFSKIGRIHIVSACKYFAKWGWR